MATTLPAMRGKFGDHEYYLCSMKANELVRYVQIPSELKEWQSESIEERYQRRLNYNRIRREIAPYLANNKDRFFGAIVVAVTAFDENVRFHSLEDLLPATAHGRVGESDKLGELWLRGGQMMVPLDGQHRVKALKFAIEGKDEKGNEMPHVIASADVANDDVAVVLIKFETRTARSIFTHVNRYARAVDKAGGIVTDDAHLFGYFARKLANELITPRLVNIDTSNMSSRDPAFTSLSALSNSVETIINVAFPKGNVKADHEPSDDEKQLYWEKILQVWGSAVDHVPEFSAALADKTESGDQRRMELRRDSLLGKPVGQEVLIHACLRLMAGGTNLNPKKACENLADLNWLIDKHGAAFWQGTIWTGSHTQGKVLTSAGKKRLAARIASHAAGEKLKDDAKRELLAEYQGAFEAGRKPDELPR